MKKILEAAKEQAYSFVHNNIEYSHPNFVANEKQQSFEDGAEFSQRWIPIEEFEMKEGEKILVKCLHGWTTGRLITQKNGKKKLSNCAYPIEIITHCRKIEVE